jgi:hypothetical protein
MNQDFSIYCNCFKNKEPKLTQFDQKNIMCGAHAYDLEYKNDLVERGYILDDSKENISELNHWFGELTGTYWVWKNTNHDVVGTNQYRHFWNVNFLDIQENTIYVPKKILVSRAFEVYRGPNVSVYDHYGLCHGYQNWDMLKNLCENKNIPLKSYMIDQLKYDYEIIPFNMFITESKIFDSICSILFEILFKYYENYKDDFPEIEKYTGQNRIIDFLSERILHMIYSNIKYYLNDIKIVNLDIRTYEH